MLETFQALSFDDIKFAVSTRPKKDYIGSLEEWDESEEALKSALNSEGIPFTIQPEEGAFYGPKIDVAVTDAFGKAHQTATVQLDFQLAKR